MQFGSQHPQLVSGQLVARAARQGRSDLVLGEFLVRRFGFQRDQAMRVDRQCPHPVDQRGLTMCQHLVPPADPVPQLGQFVGAAVDVPEFGDQIQPDLVVVQ